MTTTAKATTPKFKATPEARKFWNTRKQCVRRTLKDIEKRIEKAKARELYEDETQEKRDADLAEMVQNLEEERAELNTLAAMTQEQIQAMRDAREAEWAAQTAERMRQEEEARREWAKQTADIDTSPG